MDYKKLICEIIKELRGNLSQTHINRKIGYEYNQISRWELGKNQIFWDDFVRLLVNIYGVEMEKLLYQFYHYNGDITDASLLLNHILGNSSVGHISRELKIARVTIYNWRKGETKTPAYQMLKVFNHLCMNVEAFISAILGEKKIASTEKSYDSKQNLTEIAFKYPMIIAAALCFDLAEYKKMKIHKSGFVANKLGIDQDEEDFYIELLSENNLLIKKDDKYSIDTRHFSLQGPAKSQMDVKMFWLNQAVSKIQTINFDDGGKRTFPYTFLIFAGNNDLFENIMKKYQAFHHEIIGMVQSFEENMKEHLENIYCMNMNLFGLSSDFVSLQDPKQ